MDHTKELIKKAHEGDKEARNKLVMDNMGLVYSISRRFLGRGYELEDINQIGVIGLIKAIDKFDENFDVKLSTYAVPMISGEIKRFLRDDGMLKVSRSIKENGYKIRQVSEKLSAGMGREATLEEIAAAAELPLEDVVVALAANTEVDSIYRTIYQGDGSEVYLIDKMAGENEGSMQEEMLNNLLISQLLESLTPEERQIITMRYFGEMTQSNVAKKLGISQVQVSRMEKRILLKLRGQV